MARTNNGLLDSDFLKQTMDKNMSAFYHLFNASQNFLSAFSRYANDFTLSYLISTSYFNSVEKERLQTTSPLESVQSYMELLSFNFEILSRGLSGSLKAINSSGNFDIEKAVTALFNTLFMLDGEDVEAFLARQAKMMDIVANQYPRAIQDIEPEYGFHFERKDTSIKVAETDRFILYQILPNNKKMRAEST